MTLKLDTGNRGTLPSLQCLVNMRLCTESHALDRGSLKNEGVISP